MGLTAFSLLIVASAFQARSVTATALAGETFDNRHLNWTVLAEIVLAVLITQMDVMRRMFGTAQLTAEQWLLALAAGHRAVLPLGARQAGGAPRDRACNGCGSTPGRGVRQLTRAGSGPDTETGGEDNVSSPPVPRNAARPQQT